MHADDIIQKNQQGSRKMEKFTEPSKALDVYGSYDTVVVGGGFAGVAAALAAKQGKRVMDIDVKELQDILKQSDIIID